VRLYTRQKLLLGLLEACGGRLGATDFQKLLFLYTRKWEEKPSFKFVPYRFGCFSFQSYADRKTLIDKGMIQACEDGAWRLTSKAKPYLMRDTVKRLLLFVERTVPERGDELVARVYREYPYDALFVEYEREDLPEAGEAIEELGRLLSKYSRVALTCFEKEPESCHRHCVAEEMERKLESCPAPLHI
jgi:hypothetical protein